MHISFRNAALESTIFVKPWALLRKVVATQRVFEESGHYLSNWPEVQSGAVLEHHIVCRSADSPGKGIYMKNWFLPATLLGLSGLALVFASEKGRDRVRHFLDNLMEHGDPLNEFNKFCEDQLEVIQQNLDRVAKALEEAQPS